MYACPPLGRAGQCGFGGRGVTVYDLQIVHKIMVLIANTWGKGSENVLTRRHPIKRSINAG